MIVHYVHRKYPKDMDSRVEFKIRNNYEYPNIDTPTSYYSEASLEEVYIPYNDVSIIIRDEKLSDKLKGEYFANIGQTNPIDLPTNDNGYVTNFEWLDNINGEISLGGCYLDGCLHNGIRSIQTELYKRNEKKIISLIPSVILCWKQPGCITFQEQLDDFERILFYPGDCRLGLEEFDTEDSIRKELNKIVSPIKIK